MNPHHPSSTLTNAVRRRTACLALAAWVAWSPARAADTRLLPPVVGTTELYRAASHSALALGGADPVSYWLPGGPRPGLAGTEMIWRGLVWRFAGPANRAAFLRDPDGFLPRLDGYDATSAAEGGILPSDPGIFAVSSGRLYLFRTELNRRRFLESGMAASAEARWPRLRDTLARG